MYIHTHTHTHVHVFMYVWWGNRNFPLFLSEGKGVSTF
jgi:hypothetical protein